MSSLKERLEAGPLLLLRFESAAEFATLVGVREGLIRGEMELRAGPADPGIDEVDLQLIRFSFFSSGVPAGPENKLTGKLSASGRPASGLLSFVEENRGSVKVLFSAGLHYTALSQLQLREKVGHTYRPTLEELGGSLTGLIVREGENLYFSGRFDLTLQETQPPLGWIRNLACELSRELIVPEATGPPLGDCSQVRWRRKRHLKLLPVGFADREEDPNPTGRNRGVQIASAIEVWSKCCIELEVLDFELRVDPDRKSSDEPELVAELAGSLDPEVIEVMFVDNPLAEHNGSATVDGGTCDAKVVISDHLSADPRLLAHELGHVFNGQHPNETVVAPEWVGDAGTVMQPISTGSRTIPSTNSFFNCLRANSPVLLKLDDGCCFETDDT